RGYILDLAPGQSLVEHLLAHGFDVYMLDWNAPVDAEKHLGLADYAVGFIGDALARVRVDSGQPDVSLLGYCMGGVLAAINVALDSAGVANLVCLTTPVDFAELGAFSDWSDPAHLDLAALVAAGNVPVDLLYTAFDRQRPTARLASTIALWDRRDDADYVASHGLLDRWSADILPLAAAYFGDTIQLLMRDNALLHGRLEVGGRPVRLAAITLPFLHVVAARDQIVPRAATRPLVTMIGSPDRVEWVLPGGHVSLLAGARARDDLWPRLDHWLAPRSL
ncbi:MAG: alpha/beta fold hydrolase, partial [Janthinobacterium lividum]